MHPEEDALRTSVDAVSAVFGEIEEFDEEKISEIDGERGSQSSSMDNIPGSALVEADPIAALLDSYRRRHGLSVRELATLIGFRSIGSVTDLLGRRKQIHRDKAERILRALAGVGRPPSAYERSLPSQIERVKLPELNNQS